MIEANKLKEIAEYMNADKVYDDCILIYVPDDDPSEVEQDAIMYTEDLQQKFPEYEVYERFSDHDSIELAIKKKVMVPKPCPR